MVNYENIFRIYLDFCPFYRRRLYTITEVYNWLETADLIPPYLKMNDKDHFFVFLDFLYRNELVTPFFSKIIKTKVFGRTIGDELWRAEYENGFIRFCDDNILRESGLTYPYSFNGLEERKVNLYLYHPIQVIQIMSFLVKAIKKCLNLFQFEDFYEFFYHRISEINNKQYEDVKIKFKVSPFYRGTLKKSLNFAKWLKSEWLGLYIKMEKIGHTDLYASGHINDCRIFLIDNDDEYEKGGNLRDLESWYRKFEMDKLNYFTDEELHELNLFTRLLKDISRNCDGLNEWSDLFCLIRNNKEKLKSTLLYDVNMIQVANDLNRLLWYLRTDDLENTEDRPPGYFTDDLEAEKHYQKVLYKYNLTPEPIFIVYVEGPTELNILKKWYGLNCYVHSFGFKELLSKNKEEVKKTLDYVVGPFKSKLYFYFFDGDENDSMNADIKELLVHAPVRIKDDYYEFFEPDFVTYNFSVEDVLKAFYIYFEDDEIIVMKEEDYEDVKERIKESYNNGNSIEDTLEALFDERCLGPFEKPKFGNCLGDVIVDEIKRGENRRVFPFEDIFYKRFYPISETFLRRRN